ncbi:MAG: FKBP-type peptidyl-prolyl cis-trans isomerase [Paludibacteraceae bacterium]|nr:FKBP-type peptidyl-prolyl cis-trans isomerase [Paludibacteraceae bacterium]
MKKSAYILLFLLALTGCKQENYLDWKAMNEAWLEHNKTQPGVVTTASGLQYMQLNPSPNPTEARPNYNSTVVVDYKLYLISSYGGYNTGNLLQEGNDAVFSMQNVVSGFSEGLHMMHVHDDFALYIPYYLGYGAEMTGTEGNFGFIPPYSTLIYEVHLKAMQ